MLILIYKNQKGEKVSKALPTAKALTSFLASKIVAEVIYIKNNV